MYYTGVWQWQSGSDYLAHYQRRGAHWGERNGPPYPLDRRAVAAGYDGKNAKLYDSNKYESAKNRYKASKADYREAKDRLTEARYVKWNAITGSMYKRAKLSVKAQKQAVKASKLRLSEAKREYDIAKGERKAQKAMEKLNKKNQDKEQKSIDKADKDFDRDFNTIKLQYYSSMPGRLRQKDVDVFEYRHDVTTADAAYGDHYNKRVKEAVKELKARGLRDELADEITKRMTLKVHHEQKSTSSRAEQLLRPEYEKTGKVSDKTLLRAIKEDKSLRNEAKQEASSIRKYEPATVQKAKAMRRRGMTYDNIGNQLGLDNWTIWALVNEEQ